MPISSTSHSVGFRPVVSKSMNTKPSVVIWFAPSVALLEQVCEVFGWYQPLSAGLAGVRELVIPHHAPRRPGGDAHDLSYFFYRVVVGSF